ncbi:MAG: ABC transporter permease subunit [Candidatus Cohnella colombiensis]|uniref:ABC transporter permease subunit n=1 Tax=Candidatus Cohnella colombiensis TaxID=3121368 RepID=A0AA95EU87_9BACL|nr:MAG: ABC transporter permease subunit [Cohnella sp.]
MIRNSELDTSIDPLPLGRTSGLSLFLRKLIKQKTLVFMSVPFLIWLFVFKYVPLWGWTIAFQNYKPAKSFNDQTWVGFKQFNFMFSDDRFLTVLRNTLAMSSINFVLGFVTAITLAILLNELKGIIFKRVVQTVSYLPHFISWVVAATIVQSTLDVDGGILNKILLGSGLISENVFWLGEGKYFWGIIGSTEVWKNVGWNTIIYLAALTTIDPAQYEAAEIDGAGRFQRIWHVTLPGIRPVIIILIILNIGQIMETGFEPQYLLGNGTNIDYSENLEIFILKYGMKLGNFSLSTAAGIFKTVISVVLLFSANHLAKRMGQDRLF